MNILITGCLGTIGSKLSTELKKRGNRVWGIDSVHSEKENVFRADICNYRHLSNFLDIFKFDYVYHLAAEFGRHNGEENYEKLWNTNVVGTRHILELQVKHKFRLIFASSSEIYGEISEPMLNEFLSVHKPLYQTNDYAISKWVNELQITNFINKYGSEIVILRFFNAYGPGEKYHNYRSVVCLFCYNALAGKQSTVYKNYHRTFMYIDDFIPTLSNVCDEFYSGTIANIGGRDYRSVGELQNIICKYLNIENTCIYKEEDKHNRLNKRPDIYKAEKYYRHNPVTMLEEGIPKTIEWMKSQYDFNMYSNL